MTLINEQDCTLVIPAYNEERRISFLLEGLHGAGMQLIFVCDGNDATAEKIERFSQSFPDLAISVITRHHRLGKGGAIIEGIAASAAPYIGFMDADGSTSFEEMRRLFECLDEYDGAIGSRWLAESRIPVRQGVLRRIESRVFNGIIKILFGLSFHDTQCGAKAFRKEAVDAILPQMRSTGFEFDVELLWRMQENGYRITEVPITWTNKGDSRVKASDVSGMLINLLKLRFV